MRKAPASETGASTKFRHVREKVLPARIARAIVACAGPRRQEKFTNGRELIRPIEQLSLPETTIAAPPKETGTGQLIALCPCGGDHPVVEIHVTQPGARRVDAAESG